MQVQYPQFHENLDRVRAQIGAACERAKREASEVTLLPVTKNHSADAARFAW